jgi:tetratricopeptide (TPR) repeat protein
MAIEIKPDYAKAWNNKGNALHALSRNDEAIKAYNKAIEIKPDYADALNNKDTALSNLERKNELINESWWKRHTNLLIGLIGILATLAALLLTISQGKYSKVIEKKQIETLQSISEQLENYNPIKRDQIIKQLENANEELKTAIENEKSRNTEERKKTLKALYNENPTKAQQLLIQRIKPDSHGAWYNKGVALSKSLRQLSISIFNRKG